jgi:hypothetical protein
MVERARGRALRPIDVALAAAAAGTVSGLPSTVWAAATQRSVLEAARAAGTLIPGRRDRPGLVAGGAVHAVLSMFWTTVIAAAMRRRPVRPVDGAAAGLAIAALDLAVVGRRYPAIRALPAVAQWCDHVVFGAAAVAFLARPGKTSSGQRTRR